MKLADTVYGMAHPDYQERFKAEYAQTKIRADRLHEIIVQYEAGTIEFMPDCPLRLFKKQERAMRDYLYCLEVRAQIEMIDLSNIEFPSFEERCRDTCDCDKRGEENAERND